MPSFTVVYDACVLYPAPIRDLLIRLARAGLFRAKWTEDILDECFRTILEDRPDLQPEQLRRTRELMNQAIPDCLVTNYQELIGGLSLPDPDDRHVLAAAIRCNGQVIVTSNLKDFPQGVLAKYGIEAQDPDEFVFHLTDLAPTAVWQVVQEQAASLKNPARTIGQLLDTLSSLGLVQTAAQLRIRLPSS